MKFKVGDKVVLSDLTYFKGEIVEIEIDNKTKYSIKIKWDNESTLDSLWSEDQLIIDIETTRNNKLNTLGI